MDEQKEQKDTKKQSRQVQKTISWKDMMRENPRIIYAGMVVFLIVVMMILCVILFSVILVIESGSESVS